MNNLDHLLGRVERLANFHADRPHPHARQKFLDHLEVDIGFQQRQTDFTQSFINVGFAQLATLG